MTPYAFDFDTAFDVNVWKNPAISSLVFFKSSIGKSALFYNLNDFDAHRIFLFALKLQIFGTG